MIKIENEINKEDGMSKTRKTIVKFAQTNRYWYTHQADGAACDKANSLQRRAWALVIRFGIDDDRAAFMQAKRCTMQMVPSRGTV